MQGLAAIQYGGNRARYSPTRKTFWRRRKPCWLSLRSDQAAFAKRTGTRTAAYGGIGSTGKGRMEKARTMDFSANDVGFVSTMAGHYDLRGASNCQVRSG